MAIKDLLVAFDGNAAAVCATRLGVQMAKKYDARLSGVFISEATSFETHVLRWMTQEMQDQVREGERLAQQGIADLFHATVKDAGYEGQASWLELQGKPHVLLPRLSRYFDLMLLGQFGTDEQSRGRELQAESILLRAGKPLIIVPRSYQPRPFKEYAIVAWDGSRSAARALTDAMQILETKTRLDIVDLKRDRSQWAPPAPEHDIIAHLRLHGVAAERVTLESGTRSLGETLLDHTRKNDPDILVMGAYGRGKFGGLLFGTLTRYVLEHLCVPTLLSH